MLCPRFKFQIVLQNRTAWCLYHALPAIYKLGVLAAFVSQNQYQPHTSNVENVHNVYTTILNLPNIKLHEL